MYYGLELEGEISPFFVNGEVDRAVLHPPEGTRAMIRGQAVNQHDNIKNIHWTGIEFNSGEFLDLNSIISPADVEQALNNRKEQFTWA